MRCGRSDSLTSCSFIPRGIAESLRGQLQAHRKTFDCRDLPDKSQSNHRQTRNWIPVGAYSRATHSTISVTAMCIEKTTISTSCRCRIQSRVLCLRSTRPIKLVRTVTSLASRLSKPARPPIFIDSSEVKQYVTAL